VPDAYSMKARASASVTTAFDGGGRVGIAVGVELGHGAFGEEATVVREPLVRGVGHDGAGVLDRRGLDQLVHHQAHGLLDLVQAIRGADAPSAPPQVRTLGARSPSSRAPG
jgi:hypothetical protein